MYISRICLKLNPIPAHSFYLLLAPPAALMYFFQACAQFSTGNARGTALSELYLENINAIADIVLSLLIENNKGAISIPNTTFQITNTLQCGLFC